MSSVENDFVRTVEQLIRKYNLSNFSESAKKIKKTSDELISTEKSLTNVLNSLAINLKNIISSEENFNLYFYNMNPSDNKNINPSIGDIYYNISSGTAYIYKEDWIQNYDSNLISALALTYSYNEYDCKKKVFMVEPYVPYECGDWYIKDGYLYICQIERETGLYSKEDFVISSNYTNNTNAMIDDNILTILSGTVTKIRESVDEITIEIKQTIEMMNDLGKNVGVLEENYSKVSQTANELESTVGTMKSQYNENFANLEQDINNQANDILNNNNDLELLKNKINTFSETILKQTDEQFEMLFNATGINNTLTELQSILNSQNTTLEQLKAYIRYGMFNDSTSEFHGSPFIELGKENAHTKLMILDNRIRFMTGTVETAYISNNSLYINESTILSKQVIGRENVGRWITEIDDCGNLNEFWGGI